VQALISIFLKLLAEPEPSDPIYTAYSNKSWWSIRTNAVYIMMKIGVDRRNQNVNLPMWKAGCAAILQACQAYLAKYSQESKPVRMNKLMEKIIQLLAYDK